MLKPPYLYIRKYMKKLADTSLLQFEILQQFSNVSHGISNRHTEANQRFDVRGQQPHDNKYAWVDAKVDLPVPHVDALLTKVTNIRLRVGTSDCTPIIIYDPITHSGGVIHAGFQGTIREILKETLKEFNPKDVYIGIGPAIGPCCYDDIDIQVENYQQAIEAGVPTEQIEVIRVCTKCHSDTYYSHRAGDGINFGTYFELK